MLKHEDGNLGSAEDEQQKVLLFLPCPAKRFRFEMVSSYTSRLKQEACSIKSLIAGENDGCQKTAF